MDVSSLISLFGQEAGVNLTLSEAGTASLAFESGSVLHLEHDPQADALHCYVVLGQAPADPMRRHDVFRRMLAANAFGRDTDGATLGLDEVTGELLLSRRLDLSYADTACLRAAVESMVAVAADWQGRLNGADPTPASDAAEGMSPSGVLPPDFGLRV
ncbi:type III secretion system chaperone [Castellaniella hirudinis]|uniref:Type III secretion system chaperone n=1 Tax=Castellaniella hirudinis TaxID=1144617 RepID=A0ABV8RZZ3_9BURK